MNKAAEVHAPTMEIAVSSGKVVDLNSIQPGDVTIQDVGFALSQINRFGGHTKFPYSVAQHSVMVSHLVSERAALFGLLHDAPEAYIGDMVRPLKDTMPEFRKLDNLIMGQVLERFSVPYDITISDEVRRADYLAYQVEIRNVMAYYPDSWIDTSAEVERVVSRINIEPMHAREAYNLFIRRFCQLTNGREF